MELYIVRHGETVWNAEKRLQGRVDVELNEMGRELAGETGRKLEETAFDKIYSSPLIRAYETACLIRGHRNIPIIRDERLREICFGENEGRVVADLLAERENTFRYFFDKPQLYVAPEHGESLEQLCERAKQFLETVIEPKSKDCNRIMIVAHGALNKALLAHIKGHGIAEFWSGGLQTNCSVAIVRYDENGYRVLDDARVFWK